MIITTQQGVTLLELLFVVVLAAVLTLLALPSFTRVVDNNRVQTGVAELLASLNLARTESIKRSQRVTLCPSNAAGDDCAPGGTWGGGWLLFANPEQPAERIDSRDSVIRRFDPVAANFTLTATDAIATTGYVSYLPSGRASAAGSFVLCKDARLERAQAVNLYLSGRPQLGADDNNNGIPEGGSGADLGSC